MKPPTNERAQFESAAKLASAPRAAGQFLPTRWSVVMRAGDIANPEESRGALEQLCSAYWYPLYAYVRRSGKAVEDAQDLTQGFFAHLISGSGLATLDAGRGSFRSFLLGALKNYMISEWRRENARKRGGGTSSFSLDAEDAERRYQFEPVSGELTPELLYDRRWARAVLERVFANLRDEFRRSGKEERFERLKPHLLNEPEAGDYEARAAELGLTVSGIRTQVQRMRARFGHLLRHEIAETVAGPEQIDEELAHLFQALS